MVKKKTDDSTLHQIINLEIEKSKLKREVSMFVLNKGLLLYFCFLFIGVIGYASDNLSQGLFHLLIIMGLCVLIIGTLPYIFTLRSEEKKLDQMIEEVRMR